jgi:hypothetical protein
MCYRVLLPMVMLSAGATALHAQAIIEYGLNAGRSGAAAGAAGPGRSSAKIFEKLNQSLAGASKADGGPKPATAAPGSARPAVAAVTAPAPAAPATPPDFTALAVGMERMDLLKNVGKPSMSMSSMESSKLIETCWYRNGANNVTVILRDGKVAEISGMDTKTVAK